MLYVFYAVIFIAWMAWARAGAEGVRDTLTIGGLLLAAFAVHNFVNTVWKSKCKPHYPTGPTEDPRLRPRKRNFFTLQRPLPQAETSESKTSRSVRDRAFMGFGRESYEVE